MKINLIAAETTVCAVGCCGMSSDPGRSTRRLDLGTMQEVINDYEKTSSVCVGCLLLMAAAISADRESGKRSVEG